MAMTPEEKQALLLDILVPSSQKTRDISNVPADQ